MDSRIVELCLRFEDHLDAFSRTELFTGPSWYFHDKTLALRTTLGLRGALRDDAFFDWLYATLVSWGLHRMGPGNTKLRDIQEIRDSIRGRTTSGTSTQRAPKCCSSGSRRQLARRSLARRNCSAKTSGGGETSPERWDVPEGRDDNVGRGNCSVGKPA